MYIVTVAESVYSDEDGQQCSCNSAGHNSCIKLVITLWFSPVFWARIFLVFPVCFFVLDRGLPVTSFLLNCSNKRREGDQIPETATNPMSVQCSAMQCSDIQWHMIDSL